jgi:hypothetical protein
MSSRISFSMPLLLPTLLLAIWPHVIVAQGPTAAPRLRTGEPIPQSVLNKVQEVSGKSAASDPQASEALANALHWRYNAGNCTRKVVFRQSISLEGTTGGGRRLQEERERGYTQLEEIQRLADGWKIAATVLHSEAFRNGASIGDPLAAVFNGKTLELRLNSDGDVTAVGGVQPAIAAMRSELSPELLAGLESRLTTEAMREQAKAEFLSRYQELRGRPLLEGAWVVRGWRYHSPVGQEVDAVAAVTLLGYEEIRGVRCAQVRVAVGSGPGQFSDPAARAAVERYYQAAGPPPAMLRDTLSGDTRYWFDPSSGLLQRVRRDLQGSSSRSRGSRSETIHYRVHEETDFK